jgi:hypothetical protein
VFYPIRLQNQYYEDEFPMFRNMFIFATLTVFMLWSSLLFSQQSGTTTRWGNGTRTTFSDGSTAVISPWGSGTRTQFYNSNGSLGGSANTSSWGSGTRTQFYNSNGSLGGNATVSPWGNSTRVQIQKPNNSFGGSTINNKTLAPWAR